MTITEVIEWLEFMKEEEHTKADSVVPCDTEIALGMAIDAIKYPPKKTGKWHGVLYINDNKELKRCTCCDYLCNGLDIETGITYDYCPNCGAEMQNGNTNREKN